MLTHFPFQFSNGSQSASPVSRAVRWGCGFFSAGCGEDPRQWWWVRRAHPAPIRSLTFSSFYSTHKAPRYSSLMFVYLEYIFNLSMSMCWSYWWRIQRIWSLSNERLKDVATRFWEERQKRFSYVIFLPFAASFGLYTAIYLYNFLNVESKECVERGEIWYRRSCDLLATYRFRDNFFNSLLL